ncbi:hypothetical protein KPL74_05840 [Bacillus sp. NP157]|nr:hypothetical protein KPL74_05840 [Bacillus sp. NP157]
MKKNINATRDPNTADMFPMAKRSRGRPRKPDALTNAQRQARYRARRKAMGFDSRGINTAAVQLLASTFRDLIEADARAGQLLDVVQDVGHADAASMARHLRQLVEKATRRFA